MQEVFEKIIEKLESEAKRWEDSGTEYGVECEIAVGRGLRNAIEIVKQEAGMYNNAIIDGKYCFQTCACTEKCDKCSRLCNGDIDWYENFDNWLYQLKGE